MVASSLALLSTRFYIRLIRQRARLHPSDCLLSFVFLVILAESILTTISNWQEIQYLAAHPDFSRKIDVFVLGASSSMQENYLKVSPPGEGC